MQTVTFDELDSSLAECDAPVAAAEAHGSLCGALAAVPGFAVGDWIADLLSGSDAQIEGPARELLETLYGETHAALASGLMEIEPLLPPDDAPLDLRTSALALWCTGFLHGLGGGLPPAGAWPGSVQEVVADFSEIGRAAVGDEESEETNEVAYAELVEYVKAGAQLAYDDLAEHRAQGATS